MLFHFPSVNINWCKYCDVFEDDADAAHSGLPYYTKLFPVWREKRRV